jgi:hypothetical protein
MKQKILAIVLTSFFYSGLGAQEIRLNAFTGYLFDDHVDSYYSSTDYYEGTIKGGFRWGLGIEYILASENGIGISYYRQDTEAPITYYANGGLNSKDFDLGASWLMASFNRYLRRNNFEPYLGFEVGAVFSNLENPASGTDGSSTKFAWGLNLGSNIYFSEKIGLKVQANLHSATQAAGGGFYFGTGGVGTGVSSYSTIYQFGLGAGLVYRFSGIGKTSGQ